MGNQREIINVAGINYLMTDPIKRIYKFTNSRPAQLGAQYATWHDMTRDVRKPVFRICAKRRKSAAKFCDSR